MDDKLVDAIALHTAGRMAFDPGTDTLVHTRHSGGTTPVFATAAQIRELMTHLLLRDEDPDAPGGSLERGARLLLDHLDRFPLRALLGWDHLRSAACEPDIGPAEVRLWGDIA